MNKKKLLALLMALVMTLTLMPMTVFAEEEPDLPEASVQQIAGKQNVNLIALDTAQDFGNNPFDLFNNIVGKVDIDTIYRFATVENNRVDEFGNWNCDYRVTFNQPIKKNSAGLFGSYTGSEFGDFPDIAFLSPVDIEASTPIYLLYDFGFDGVFTYNDVVKNVGTFDCGVFNVGDCNKNTVMTVELVIKNPETDVWYTVGDPVYYTFGSATPITAKNGEFVYDVTGTYNIDKSKFDDEAASSYTFKKYTYAVETGTETPVDVNTTLTSSVDSAALNTLQNQGVSEQTVINIRDESSVVGVKLSTQPTVTPTEPAEEPMTGLQAILEKAAVTGDTDTTPAEAEQAINGATLIEVEVNVVVTPKEYINETSTQTATFDLTPYATVTATKTEGNAVVSETTIENVPVTNEMIDQTHDIVVSIYTGFQPQQIIHEDDDGNVIDTFNGNEIIFENGVATVTVRHFSKLTATAQINEARIGNTDYATLEEAFAAVHGGETITLLSDVELESRLFVNAGETPSGRYATTTENKIITLDLNNHNIQSNSNIALAGGTLNITGTGTISTSASGLAPVEIYGRGNLDEKRTLTIGSGVTLEGSEYGLNVFGSNNGDKNLIDVTVDGTVNGTLFVLGNLKNTSNVINIVINGTVSGGANNIGVSLNGYGNVTVNDGANVSGKTGIEVRAGNLAVTGGTIQGTGTTYTSVSNGNGSSTSGAGIAVVQHTTHLPITTTLTGGTVTAADTSKAVAVDSVESGTNMAVINVTAEESYVQNQDVVPEGYEWKETTNYGTYELAEKELTFRGASLRRRVYTGTTEVVFFETDLRFGFMLPTGAEVNTDASYFRWSLSENVDENTGNRIDIKNVDTSGSRPLVNMVITKIPMAYYTSEIYCHAHIVYTIGGASHTVDTHVDGNDPIMRSVKDVCEGLIAKNDTTTVWPGYAQSLKTAAGWANQ